MAAPLPATEEQRLAALEELEILDSQSEAEYDDLVHLAAYICQSPIALVSLVAQHRQWFKARVGLDASETSRDLSFCAHAILQPSQVMEVPDATKDPRFADNDFVTGDSHIRFYAGAPLVTPEGHALGSICVIDRVPRHLTAQQREMLERLSHQVVALMQLRVRVRELDETSTRLRTLADKLSDSEERFSLFMDHSPMLAFIKDTQGRYTYVNECMAQRFGRTKEEFLGKTDRDFWPEHADELMANDAKALAADGTAAATTRFEESVTDPSGITRTWMSYKFPIQDDEGERFLAGLALDITQQKFYENEMLEYQGRLEQAVAQMEELALTDALTGLRNKGSFEARLDEEVSRSRRYHLPLSLMMVDIDHFKKINDDFGHPTGDEVLQRMAALLRESARPSDFVARYGGEEFAMILPNTGTQGAYFVAERLRQIIEEAPPTPRAITISAGVASLSPGESARSLLSRADKALYHAKNTGRNRVSMAEMDAYGSAASTDF